MAMETHQQRECVYCLVLCVCGRTSCGLAAVSTYYGAAEHSVCEVLLVLSHGLSLVYVLLGVVCLSLQLVLYCGALFIHRDTTIWAYASPCSRYCLWLSMYWATRGVLLSISMYSSYSQRVQVPARMQARPIETR